MPEERVRVGLVGAGFQARVHANAYRHLSEPRATVVAVAAARQARAETLAGECGAAAYDDYRRLLERPDVDVVDLCLPNDLHEEVAVAAAQAGKHVIVEKPLTGYFGGTGAAEPVGTTPRALMLKEAVASAERILSAARRAGVRVMYAENWVYAPALQKIVRLAAASGSPILEIRGQECHSGSHAAYAKTWRTSGGGALLRLGAHPIGGALYLKWQEGLRSHGTPTRVRAVTAEVSDLAAVAGSIKGERWLKGGEDTESWGTAILSFADDTRATLFAADTVLGGIDLSLDVYLANGRVLADMAHSNLLLAYAPSPEVFAEEYLAEKLETKAGWSFPSVDEEFLLGFPQELHDFTRAVAHGSEPQSTGKLGLEVVKVIYAAYLSAEQGRRVELLPPPAGGKTYLV